MQRLGWSKDGEGCVGPGGRGFARIEDRSDASLLMDDPASKRRSTRGNPQSNTWLWALRTSTIMRKLKKKITRERTICPPRNGNHYCSKFLITSLEARGYGRTSWKNRRKKKKQNYANQQKWAFNGKGQPDGLSAPLAHRVLLADEWVTSKRTFPPSMTAECRNISGAHGPKSDGHFLTSTCEQH